MINPTISHTLVNQPPSIWLAFRISLFRAVWIATFVSNIGTWMQNTAGVWLLTTLTTSSLLVSLMQTATSLPVFLLSLPAGVIADLVDRRRLLLATQLFMAAVALLLAWPVTWGRWVGPRHAVLAGLVRYLLGQDA